MRGLARLGGLAAVLALALLLGACAKNGQFDPTEFFSSDMFDNKKKLKGERKELFPTGVPGATTGVPPDLIKGYQAPPEQTASEPLPDGAPAPGAGPAAAAEAAAEEPKPKPKPKIARAKANSSIWDKKSPSRPTQIEVNAPAPAADAAPRQQPQQGGQPWPDPKPAQQQQAGQSVWPAAPAPGTFAR